MESEEEKKRKERRGGGNKEEEGHTMRSGQEWGSSVSLLNLALHSVFLSRLTNLPPSQGSSSPLCLTLLTHLLLSLSLALLRYSLFGHSLRYTNIHPLVYI